MSINSIHCPTHLVRSPSSLKQPSEGQKNAGKRVIEKRKKDKIVKSILDQLYKKESKKFKKMLLSDMEFLKWELEKQVLTKLESKKYKFEELESPKSYPFLKGGAYKFEIDNGALNKNYQSQDTAGFRRSQVLSKQAVYKVNTFFTDNKSNLAKDLKRTISYTESMRLRDWLGFKLKNSETIKYLQINNNLDLALELASFNISDATIREIKNLIQSAS